MQLQPLLPRRRGARGRADLGGPGRKRGPDARRHRPRRDELRRHHLRTPGDAGEFGGDTSTGELAFGAEVVPPVSRTPSPSLSIYNVGWVVLGVPPSGSYDVEVVAQPFPANSFNQLRSQPFALVFVGSGEVARVGGMSPEGEIPFY